MEESGSHKLYMTERKHLLVTDVIDVDSFDLSSIILKTRLGGMEIKGNDIHVKRLNLEKGEIEIEGEFVSVLYTVGKKQKEESLIKRMFK